MLICIIGLYLPGRSCCIHPWLGQALALPVAGEQGGQGAASRGAQHPEGRSHVPLLQLVESCRSDIMVSTCLNPSGVDLSFNELTRIMLRQSCGQMDS